MTKKHLFSGFTLLELLTVVTIIGILVTIVAGALKAAQIRGRDSQRKSQINIIAQGLDLYYASNHTMPGSPICTKVTSAAGNGWIANLDTTYIPSTGSRNTPPTDPRNTGNYVYTYQCLASGDKNYKLTATLENTNDPDGVTDPVTNFTNQYIISR